MGFQWSLVILEFSVSSVLQILCSYSSMFNTLQPWILTFLLHSQTPPSYLLEQTEATKAELPSTPSTKPPWCIIGHAFFFSAYYIIHFLFLTHQNLCPLPYIYIQFNLIYLRCRERWWDSICLSLSTETQQLGLGKAEIRDQ